MFEDINQAVNQQRFDGDWAWFKLLDSADLRSQSRSNKQQVVFANGGREATYELSSKIKGSPFDTARLRAYRGRGLL
jgi:type VI secretion system protein ImpL